MTLEEMTEGMARGWGEHDARAFLQLQLERARRSHCRRPRAARSRHQSGVTSLSKFVPSFAFDA